MEPTESPTPAAAEPKPGAAGPAKGGDGWLRDNLEAIAVAIIMALLIRHFCVEAFRIPTSSMEPTLRGQSAEHSGDRILVNKLGYYFGEPQRWHVVVFKYPLNRSRNYIKRIIGLGGESVDIRGGDIWINDRIVRKPAHVQDELWREVFELQRAIGVAQRNAAFIADLNPENGSEAEDPGRALADEVGFRDPADVGRVSGPHLDIDARGKAETAWVAMPERGSDGGYVAHDQHYNEIGDLRMRCTLTPTPGNAGAVWLRIGPVASRFRIRLPIGSGQAAVWHNPDGTSDHAGLGEQLDVAPSVTLAAGQPAEIVVAHIDGAVELSVNGTRLLRHEYEPPAPPYDAARWDGTPAIGCEDAAVRVTALTLDRDLHYLRENPQRLPYEVPTDHFLMLGDNSGSSKDSRLWKSVEFDLVDGLVEGNVLRGDGDTNAMGDDGLRQYLLDEDRGTLELVDDSGRRWLLGRDQIRNFNSPRTEPAPFVPRDNLVGRAFFVFFPLGRIAFIR